LEILFKSQLITFFMASWDAPHTQPLEVLNVLSASDVHELIREGGWHRDFEAHEEVPWYMATPQGEERYYQLSPNEFL